MPGRQRHKDEDDASATLPRFANDFSDRRTERGPHSCKAMLFELLSVFRLE